jgi:hypothetical protein
MWYFGLRGIIILSTSAYKFDHWKDFEKFISAAVIKENMELDIPLHAREQLFTSLHEIARGNNPSLGLYPEQ